MWNLQSSFLGGEWSKSAQGRMDDPAYKTAMSVCRNAHPIETGAWARRSGTLSIMETRLGLPARVNKYDLSQASPYNLVFSDLALRFQAGLRYATTNDAQTITAISSTTPVQITTQTAHGHATGDSCFLSQLGLQFLTLQNRQFQIIVIDGTNFTLADVVSTPGTSTPVPPDASFGAIAGTETVSFIQEVMTPYASQDWPFLRVVQGIVEKNSVPQSLAIILSRRLTPYVLTSNTDNAPDAQFSLEPSNFIDGPYFDPIGGGATVTPGSTAGVIVLTIEFLQYDSARAYNKGDFVSDSSINYESLIDLNSGNTPASSPSDWAVVDPGVAVGPNGFVQTDIGRHIRLFSEPPTWDTGASYGIGNVVKFNGTYWTALEVMTGATPTTGDINPNQPGNLATTWAVNAAGALWTWGKVVELGGGSGGGPIPGNTGTPIGNMTVDGGIASAFDGNLSKPAVISAVQVVNTSISGGVNRQLDTYVGKNYSISGAEAIQQVTVTPTNDLGFFNFRYATAFRSSSVSVVLTLELRAKSTVPSGPSDGIVLGSSVQNFPVGTWVSGGIGNGGFTPVTIISNDQVTTWNYVWVRVLCSLTDNSFGSVTNLTINNNVCQVQMATPQSSGTAAVQVQLIGPNLLYETAISVWRLGLYSDTTGYPTAGGYHEGRLVLNGPIPNRLDASESNGIFIFSPTEQDGTVTDNDAISYTFNATDVNALLWFESDQQGLIVGTQAGEWLVQATTLSAILTPTSIQAHRMTRIRCANIEPRRTDHTLVFVQNHGRRLMEYFADVFSGKYQAPNLAEKSKHLTAAGIAEIAYQQDLVPIIWSRMTDNTLAGTTYKRDSLMSSQGPTFNGWHRHDLGTGRPITSIAVGPSANGELESLSMITQPLDNAVAPYMVEMLADVYEDTSSIFNAQFLDGAITPSSFKTDPLNGVALNGLWRLNGQTVTVFGCGMDLGDYLVTNGSLTVPYGDGLQQGTAEGHFTYALMTTLGLSAQFLVGMCFTSQGQQLRPVLPEQTGFRMGIALAVFKRAAKYAMLWAAGIARTLGVGTVVSTTRVVNFKSPASRPLTNQQVYSGVFYDTLDDGGASANTPGLAWTITRPLPAIIPATIADVEAGNG